jgi:rhamnulokinase
LSTRVVAIDFGAGSIRICRVTLDDDGPPTVHLVHRYPHTAVSDGKSLRWDLTTLIAGMERGLQAALDAGPVASIGVDTWGVDYGLLDHRSELLEPPYAYRDARTGGYREILRRIGERRYFEVTGLQVLPFNTLFQLAAHDRGVLDRARHLLLLPELLVHHLTGRIVGEFTSAGTTGLLDVRTREWSAEMIAHTNLQASAFPELQAAGTLAGSWHGIPVHLVGGHDTASAVIAGSRAGCPFVASGTWLLAGREQDEPDLSDAAFAAGLSNEQGALGGIRLLRNVAGWWLVDECLRKWRDIPLDELLADAADVAEVTVVDATDPRLTAPADMEAALRELAALPPSEGRAAVTRVAVESMAASAAGVLKSLPARDGWEPSELRLFGGGSQAGLLRDMVERHTGLPVIGGPVEASALGNALVQAIALGLFASLDEARATIATVKEHR